MGLWKSNAAKEAWRELVKLANDAMVDIPRDILFIEALQAKSIYQGMIAEAYKTATQIEAQVMAQQAAVISALKE